MLALVGYFTLPIVPYIIVEAQTALFGRQAEAILSSQLAAEGDDPHIRMLKVLLVGYHYRQVYAVSPCDCPKGNAYAGWTYDLRYTAHGWTGGNQNDGEVVWSDCGSADSYVFPPYAGQGDFP
jgi:hypothetical protein